MRIDRVSRRSDRERNAINQAYGAVWGQNPQSVTECYLGKFCDIDVYRENVQ